MVDPQVYSRRHIRVIRPDAPALLRRRYRRKPRPRRKMVRDAWVERLRAHRDIVATLAGSEVP